LIQNPEDGKETAMIDKNVYDSVKAVGMDVHYKFSTVTMRNADGKVVRRERLDHSDRQALREKLAQWPADAPMVMEASFGWGWLVDLMREVGLHPELSNCYKLEQMRKARGWAKTNKKDGDLLSLLPFEADGWWRVWIAPPEVRDRRERMRHRTCMVKMQTETKNRISAILHRHGIMHEFSDLFGLGGRMFLAEICRQGGTEQVRLPDGARAALASLLELLAHLRKQLAEIAAGLRVELNRNELARLLDGIPGVGLILSHTLMSEIGQVERFRDHRALAGYSLLAPIADDTGEDDGRKPIGRHLGHRGNKTLKWALLEAAHGAVKRGGKWRRMFDAATEGGTKDRNRGYIKVARELVKAVHVVMKKRVEYSDSPPPRPGSSPRQKAERFLGITRSGTGQSYQPMAVVQ
jgi:transposase